MRVLGTFCLLSTFFIQAAFAQFGKDGNAVVVQQGTVVNAYSPLFQSANAGDLSLNVDVAMLDNGSPLSFGDLLLVIGMQGAEMITTNTINYGDITGYNSVGLYEFVFVCGVSSPNSVQLFSPLVNTYSVGGRNRVQVVRVPLYKSLVIDANASLTASPWNGDIGGVLALDVLDTISIHGSVDASQKGYRGGVVYTSSHQVVNQSDYVTANNTLGAQKGESIFGNQYEYTLTSGAYSRGAPANGGGGGCSHNSGGGGGGNGDNGLLWNGYGNPDLTGGAAWVSAWNLEGGNFSQNNTSGGGRGGYSYGLYSMNAATTPPGNSNWGGDYRRNVGGLGGRPLNNFSGQRFFMGGGGGAGEANNDFGTSGENGGGCIFVHAKSVIGTGAIVSNGGNALTTSTSIGKDGAGGGGGGGSVVVFADVAHSISLIAKGGNGGNQFITTNESEGPGGGGGGGVVAKQSGSPSIVVTGGLNGTTNSGGVLGFTPNGATMGASGSILSVLPLNLSVFTILKSSANCTSVTLQINSSGNVAWSNGTSGNTTVVTSPGIYSASVICGSDSVVITDTVYQSDFNGSLVLNASTTNASCNNSNGSANVVVIPQCNDCSYLWNTGDTLSSISDLHNGNYSVTVTSANGCSATTGAVVGQTPMLSVFHVIKPEYCNFNDGKVELTATGGVQPYSFSWSNGDTSYIIQNLSSGLYSYTVSDADGCSVTAAAVIGDTSVLKTQLFDTVVCPGSAVSIESTAQAQSYVWNTSVTTKSIVVFSSGIYAVTAIDQGCTYIDSFVVVSQNSPSFSLGSDTTVCGDFSKQLFALDGTVWSNGVVASTITIKTPGLYWAEATNACGTFRDTLFIVSKYNDCLMAIPTAFSPNGDGVNDVFRAVTFCQVSDFTMRIYNRWGELVFQTFDVMDGWDGAYKQTAQPVGVFIYYTEYWNECTDEKEVNYGNVTLLR